MSENMKRRYRFFLASLLLVVFTIIGFTTVSDKIRNKKEVILSDAAENDIKTVDVVHYSVDMSDTGEDGTEDFDTVFAVPVGEPIGIYVKTEGVMVINTGEVTGEDGKIYSPCKGKLKQGDYITSIDGVEVNDKTTLVELVNEADGAPVLVGIRRDDSEFYVSITPAAGKNNRYMLGLWVKDDISGIGTLTYITKDSFGALGHSINDNDTGALFDISDGAIFPADIVNIRKPNQEQPGRLEGLIDYKNQNILGRVSVNCKYGITGNVTDQMAEMYKGREWIPVGHMEDVHTGDAYILSCISGEPVYYNIEITKVSYSENNSAMGMGLELKVKDDRLLELTGGIVQGMSGTPIIQDGKLVGAVTHVFLKDPTMGYGTFVEEMMTGE